MQARYTWCQILPPDTQIADHQAQADTLSVHGLRIFQLTVLLKKFSLIFLTYPDPCVDNFDYYSLKLYIIGHIDRNCAFLREFNRIFYQVDQHLGEADFVSLQEQLIVIFNQTIFAFIFLMIAVNLLQLDLIKDDIDAMDTCLLLEHILDQVDCFLWLEDVHILCDNPILYLIHIEDSSHQTHGQFGLKVYHVQKLIQLYPV